MQAIESDFIKSECNLVFQAFLAARELRYYEATVGI